MNSAEITSILVGTCVGVGLSAACGFRVFVPMLVLSIAAKAGCVPVAENFQWVASYPAILALSVATVCEVLAYFIPVVDHFLDAIASPVALVAGTLVTAAVITHADPWLQWSLALIAGGGIAAVTQTSTVSLRAGSFLTTGGLANPLVAAGEAISSLVLSILSIVLPFVAAAIGLVVLLVVVGLIRRFRRAS